MVADFSGADLAPRVPDTHNGFDAEKSCMSAV